MATLTAPILDIRNLLVEILVGDRDLQHDAVLLRFGCHRLRELDIEWMLLREERCSDHDLSGLSGMGTCLKGNGQNGC